MISLIYLPIMVSLCVPLHDSAYVMMIVMRIKEKPAYSDVGFSEKWIATVQNPNNIEIQFYAIDKRIKIFITGNEQSLCDGMLRFSDSLYLVELKVKQKKWASEAVDQLKNTIVFLKQYHASALAQLRTKEAYACNRKYPNFPYSRRDQIRRFYNETGFRLDIQATINIK